MTFSRAVVQIIFSSLLVSPSLPVQTSNVGVVVQTWNYDAPKKELIVRFANMSDKNVTAFAATQTIYYTDGTSSTGERTEDVLGGEPAFSPGSIRDFALGDQRPIRNVIEVVNVVIYEDRSAEVRNERGYRTIITQRKEMILALQKANEIVKQSASPEDAAKEMERLAKVSHIRTSDAVMPSGATLQVLAQNLRQGTDRDQFLKHNEEQITKLTPHVTISKKNTAEVQQ